MKKAYIPVEPIVRGPINITVNFDNIKKDSLIIKGIVDKKIGIKIGLRKLINIWVKYSCIFYDIEWVSAKKFTAKEVEKIVVGMIKFDEFSSAKKVMYKYKYNNNQIVKMVIDKIGDTNIEQFAVLNGVKIKTLKNLTRHPSIISFEMYVVAEKILGISLEELTSFEEVIESDKVRLLNFEGNELL